MRYIVLIITKDNPAQNIFQKFNLHRRKIFFFIHGEVVIANLVNSKSKISVNRLILTEMYCFFITSIRFIVIASLPELLWQFLEVYLTNRVQWSFVHSAKLTLTFPSFNVNERTGETWLCSSSRKAAKGSMDMISSCPGKLPSFLVSMDLKVSFTSSNHNGATK